ncbi:hypothetical protein DXG03_004564 [Asterophora parasitica]|uniref:SAC3/GANP/THP3 conserved domain-containing protein n=1 Tax=Asterophora parasitica TaxID=117018 RepID=A0A9P7G3X3_9AGAR|nr:hypothetical protein DXG03_004564 [Asterophora parasitica]
MGRGRKWWERGHRGGRGGRGVRGRAKFSNVSLRLTHAPRINNAEEGQDIVGADEHIDESEEEHLEEEVTEPEEPLLETKEEQEKYFQTLVKARELERKKAIAEGKMDDPNVPKRLEDAISVVGTCQDMCPRFERYRRERESNLQEWELIPGTKRVDHRRAVKAYERAAGDKILPSDLRPPPVLKTTLNYLFNDLLLRGGFSATQAFVRDRTRAVRNDFTIQHSYGPEAIECHDRCARFHILAIHFGRNRENFSLNMEEQQLMNTLQSLKEFYEDQRGQYQSPTELEMRVYHRLIHIRDQKERHEDIPDQILSNPVFKLTTDFRIHVQRKSEPISKNSPLVVDAVGMQIFGRLANVLREQGSAVMVYLVACILEHLFGTDAIDDIESIRGDLSIPNLIDGISSPMEKCEDQVEGDEDMYDELLTEDEQQATLDAVPTPTKPGAINTTSSPFGSPPVAEPQMVLPPPAASAFSTISTTPNVFGSPSPFGMSTFPTSATPALGVPAKYVFETSSAGSPEASTSTGAAPLNVFGTGLSFAPTPQPPPPPTFPSAPTKQPTIFSLSAKTTPSNFTSLSPTAMPNKVPSSSSLTPPPAKTPFGEFSLFGTSGSLLKASQSIETRLPERNPTATSYMKTAPFASSSSFASIPVGEIFLRSSNPSPSPHPPDNNTPSTPAPPPLTSTSSSFSNPPRISPPTSGRTSTTPPVLPKINTDTTSTPFHCQPLTPTLPPPLPRQQPISLPSTPVLSTPPNPLLTFRKDSLATPIASSSQDILSPLVMPSPTTSGRFHGFPFHGKGSSKGNALQPAPPPNGQGKSRARSPLDEEALRNKASQFAQRSTLVRSYFRRWYERIVEHGAWLEACQQSDAYREKIKQQSPAHFDKKRRISAGPGTIVELPLKKRARRRVSSDYHPPRTDEELARRFKKNHEEHERRWAQGSFLKVIANHVKTRLDGAFPHDSWRIWLSMNPDSDATAIWLERKFDMPASGDWVSEAVFSIPLAPKHPGNMDSPGLVVFECSPLECVSDELERKYRILDDCSRLRDIVNAFPSRRHFIPSLLVISWTEEEQAKPATDFADMVNKLVQSQSMNKCHTLSITSATRDLDEKFDEALKTLTLDLEGKLVQSLPIHGIFKVFEPSFTRDPKTKFFIGVSDITSALEERKAAFDPHKARLEKALHMSVRRSPKRRSTSVDTELLSRSRSKRRRLSSPVESQLGEDPTPLTSPYMNGHATPSPTPTNLSLAPSDGSSVVTIAMLRALTKDMKKKYTGSA